MNVIDALETAWLNNTLKAFTKQYEQEVDRESELDEKYDSILKKNMSSEVKNIVDEYVEEAIFISKQYAFKCGLSIGISLMAEVLCHE